MANVKSFKINTVDASINLASSTENGLMSSESYDKMKNAVLYNSPLLTHIDMAKAITDSDILLDYNNPLYTFELTTTLDNYINGKYVHNDTFTIVTGSSAWGYCKVDLTNYIGLYINLYTSVAHSDVSPIVIYDNNDNPISSTNHSTGVHNLFISSAASYALITFNSTYDEGRIVNIFKSSGSISETISNIQTTHVSVYNDTTMHYTELDNFFKAIYVYDKDSYPYGIKIGVVTRNTDRASYKWIIRLYENTSSDDIGSLIFDYSTNTNPEGDDGIQSITLNNIIIVVDWTKIDDGYYKTNMNSSQYLISSACYSVCGFNETFCITSIQNKISESLKYPIEWNLPQDLKVNSSYEYIYYEDTLFKNWEYYRRCGIIINVETDCTSFEHYDGCGKIQCDGTYIKFSAIMINDGLQEILSTHTMSLSIHTINGSGTLNIIFIGDSYIDNTYGTTGIIGHIQELALNNGVSVISKGTRTTQYGILSEAYSGWSESTFLTYIPTSERAEDAPNTTLPTTGVSSPFMFSDDDTSTNAKFDFQEYIDSNSIGDVDGIVFFLGMNGGNGSNIYKMIYGGDDVIKTSIRDTLSETPIYICFVPSYWGHDNIDELRKINGQISRINQNINYDTLFNGKDNISLIPVNCYHRVYGYRSRESSVFSHSQGTIVGDVTLPSAVFTYDHHPSTFGVNSIASAIIGAIL